MQELPHAAGILYENVGFSTLARQRRSIHTHQKLTSDTTCASNVLWLTATRHRHARSCRPKDVC